MVTRCAGPCGRPMVNKGQPIPHGHVQHNCRRLCNGCYYRARLDDTLADYLPMNRQADEVLGDWDILRRAGDTREEAAEKLGMKVDALERMIYRHRGRDPRAVLGRRSHRGRHLVRDAISGRWS